MTIKIEVECDGRDCNACREIDDYTDRDVEKAGWGIDHINGCHYCSKCWPIARKELAEIEEESTTEGG